MNLFETLKQFKNIEPGADYKEKSRRIILASAPTVQPWSLKRTLLGVLETGTAVALTGFFIFLLAGGFSGSSKLAPVELEAVDPASIQAEAQAIDIQIQLANLNYKESTAAESPESTPASPTKPALLEEITPILATTSSATSSATSSTPVATTSTPTVAATSTASSTITIDQALEKLSQ